MEQEGDEKAEIRDKKLGNEIRLFESVSTSIKNEEKRAGNQEIMRKQNTVTQHAI